jgi:hypothetical protein
MSIAFTCLSCGKLYRVDAKLAGRMGRCKACGRPMEIPSYIDDGDDTIATEGYDLSEPLPVAAAPEATGRSVFVPAGLEPEVPRRTRRRPVKSHPDRKRSRRDEDETPFHVRHFGLLVAIPSILVAGLILTALIAPNGTLIVACIVAVLGALLVLAGYLVGLWAAFREDSLYGFLYFFIPLYTAYYIVTRWDDLRPFFIAMTVGVGLVVIAGLIAESKLGREPVPVGARPVGSTIADRLLFEAAAPGWSAIADPTGS